MCPLNWPLPLKCHRKSLKNVCIYINYIKSHECTLTNQSDYRPYYILYGPIDNIIPLRSVMVGNFETCSGDYTSKQ